MPAINRQLQTLKETKADELTRPVTAFLTFNTQEGYERALKNYGPDAAKPISTNREGYYFCDSKIEVEPAPEPSNIIWENRFITEGTQRRNKIAVAFGILCLLALAFLIFTIAKK